MHIICVYVYIYIYILHIYIYIYGRLNVAADSVKWVAEHIASRDSYRENGQIYAHGLHGYVEPTVVSVRLCYT